MSLRSKVRNTILKLIIWFYPRSFFKKISFKNVSFELLLNKSNGYIDREFMIYGIYEKEIFSLIYDLASKDKVFVDIWANIGQYTNFWSILFKHVFAFEPINRIYRQNLISLRKNGLTNVSLFNVALWEKDDNLKIYENSNNVWNSSLFSQVCDEHKGGDLSEYVKVQKWDNIISWPIDLVKIDVEGYELYALKGMNNLLELYSPDIIMEFSNIFYKRIHPDMPMLLLSFLQEKRYTFYKIDKTIKQICSDEILSSPYLNIFCTKKWII